VEHPALEHPADEDGRLDAVRRYDVLDTPPDGAFERVTRLAARLLGTPIAIVSIVDHDRIWFKSRYGLDVDEVGRDPGLCASAILHDGPWVIEDARRDPRALANPLVAGEFGLQFYAGAPLRTKDGHNLGTVCVIDREPRELDEAGRSLLEDLAAIVVDELELRLAARQVEAAAAEQVRLADNRRRQSMQLNDDVVQSLALAKLLLDVGDTNDIAGHVARALVAAKQILGEMATDAPSLRREPPAH
jgi:GAF domain-containing protein